MARFRYIGHPARPNLVVQYGELLEIKVPTKSNGDQTLLPVPPATHFLIGEDIGHEISEERSLRSLRADTKFTEIL